MLIFITHNSLDLIASVLKKNESVLGQNVEIVTTRDVLDAKSIQDSISQDSININWILNDNRLFTNSKTNFIYNRILRCDSSLYEDFKEEDQFYVKKEFESYLGFAINAFANQLELTGPVGYPLNGFLSLPAQWNILSNIGIDVPKHTWGINMETETHLNSQFQNTKYIRKSIYDYGNWRDSNEQMPLNVEIIKGRKVFVLQVGEEQLVTCIKSNSNSNSNSNFSSSSNFNSSSNPNPNPNPNTNTNSNNNIEIDNNICEPSVIEKIKEINKKVTSELKLFLSESFYIVNEDSVPILSHCTQAISMSNKNANFEQTIVSGFKKYFINKQGKENNENY